jgi:hypothetical protein
MGEREGCYAPVFRGASGLECLAKILAWILLIILLAIFAWFPPVLCLIKQLTFRIRHCTEGNENPEIPL